MKQLTSVSLPILCVLLFLTSSPSYGSYWVKVNNGLTNIHVQCMVAVGTDMLVGTADGLFRSTDNGESWMNVLDVGMGGDVKELATDGESVIAKIDSAFYLSTTRGTGDWVLIDVSTLPMTTAGGRVYRSYPACFAVISPTIIVATGRSAMGPNPGIYTMTNLGITWTQTRYDGSDDNRYQALIKCGEGLYLVGWNGDLLTNNVRIECSKDTGVSWESTAALPQDSGYPSFFNAYCVDGTDLYVSIVAERGVGGAQDAPHR